MDELVYFDEENKVSIAQYNGFLTLEEFQSIATAVQELRDRHSSNVQLAVVENMKVLSPEIMGWINSNWFPEAVATGLEFLGFIIPKSTLAEMSMKTANKDAEKESPIDIQYFSRMEDALAWIQKVK